MAKRRRGSAVFGVRDEVGFGVIQAIKGLQGFGKSGSAVIIVLLLRQRRIFLMEGNDPMLVEASVLEENKDKNEVLHESNPVRVSSTAETLHEVHLDEEPTQDTRKSVFDRLSSGSLGKITI
ncbi:hypothetical protein L6452_31029 [Arctium lappa]|uniref:Uncharacterized protein n=1 Tax=Arctium lappa TaxID=4217 RepID=A0ACB8ZJL7_ARCLA|nr:hypothetical protein L6452_31029 [Arctium lappa]